MSSNDESSTDASDKPAEVVADSPHQQDESLTSSPRAGLTLMSSGDDLDTILGVPMGCLAVMVSVR